MFWEGVWDSQQKKPDSWVDLHAEYYTCVTPAVGATLWSLWKAARWGGCQRQQAARFVFPQLRLIIERISSASSLCFLLTGYDYYRSRRWYRNEPFYSAWPLLSGKTGHWEETAVGKFSLCTHLWRSEFTVSCRAEPLELLWLYSLVQGCISRVDVG